MSAPTHRITGFLHFIIHKLTNGLIISSNLHNVKLPSVSLFIHCTTLSSKYRLPHPQCNDPLLTACLPTAKILFVPNQDKKQKNQKKPKNIYHGM